MIPVTSIASIAFVFLICPYDTAVGEKVAGRMHFLENISLNALVNLCTLSFSSTLSPPKEGIICHCTYLANSIVVVMLLFLKKS